MQPREHPPAFLLTVDTEEEWDWSGDFPRPPFSVRNIAEVPAFQTYCADLGVRPTYFVDHAVAADEQAAATLRSYLGRGECDFGAHLHPWATPPHEEVVTERSSHAVNLPHELFERKMETLTERLRSAFGRHPYSYRAGRWGVNGTHLRTLARLGYRIDSSVRPFYADTCFSYADASTRPYSPSFDDVLVPDSAQADLLEVPVSSGFDRADFERLATLHARLARPPLSRLRLIGVLWRLRLMRKITVTPEGHDAVDVCRCIDAVVRRGDPVINLFFHSSDLLPGATPYVRDAADKCRFLDCIARCVEHARSAHGATFLTVREVRSHLTGVA